MVGNQAMERKKATRPSNFPIFFYHVPLDVSKENIVEFTRGFQKRGPLEANYSMLLSYLHS